MTHLRQKSSFHCLFALQLLMLSLVAHASTFAPLAEVELDKTGEIIIAVEPGFHVAPEVVLLDVQKRPIAAVTADRVSDGVSAALLPRQSEWYALEFIIEADKPTPGDVATYSSRAYFQCEKVCEKRNWDQFALGVGYGKIMVVNGESLFVTSGDEGAGEE